MGCQRDICVCTFIFFCAMGQSSSLKVVQTFKKKGQSQIIFLSNRFDLPNSTRWLWRLITSDIEKSALYLIPTSKYCIISLWVKLWNDSSLIMISAWKDFTQYRLHNYAVCLFICTCVFLYKSVNLVHLISFNLWLENLKTFLTSGQFKHRC